jgi:mycofactocin system glycosyltransferase
MVAVSASPFGRFLLDASYRRPGDGSVVVAGSPLRLFRLSAGGRRVAERLEAGLDLPAGHERLTDRLMDAGAIHPRPELGHHGSYGDADVTVVVPTLDTSVTLVHEGPVVVVDDGSTDAVEVPPGARLLRHPASRGPGAARNTALAEVTTPLVAFVDSDVQLPPGWLAPLLAHFADPRLVAAAPRVRSAERVGLLAAYERIRSPLDLGGQPARVAAGSRVSYVPSAVLVCRTDAVRAVGGFDPALRFGEDVDLVWRLSATGRCRYEPDSEVTHAPRATWRAWLAQRAAYGSSAARLARRHPGAVAPLRASGWSLAVWALILLRRPVIAVGVGAWTAVALRRTLADLPASVTTELVVRGHLGTGRQLADATRRAWWPAALVAAACSRWARLPVLAAALAQALQWRPGQGIDPIRYTAVRLADDMAYGVGLWRGVWAERDVDALLPEVRRWPGRERD